MLRRDTVGASNPCGDTKREGGLKKANTQIPKRREDVPKKEALGTRHRRESAFESASDLFRAQGKRPPPKEPTP